jgi:hypothetical protein
VSFGDVILHRLDELLVAVGLDRLVAAGLEAHESLLVRGQA